jgi:putative ABC transport system ATP-binding protein
VGLTAARLEAHNLYRFYHVGGEETLALRGVSLLVRPAETVTITGPSGSGKSTLLNCLAGLDEPDGGWVAVMGERMTRRPEAERADLRARHIGMLLQSGNLLEHLTVADNLRVAMCLARGVHHRVGMEAVLSAVGLAKRAHVLPAHLSGGERARAGLAVALINNPPVLLADEPTGEVDAANEALLLDLLIERARKGGANLIVTHSQAVAAAANRVLHLVDGRLEDD